MNFRGAFAFLLTISILASPAMAAKLDEAQRKAKEIEKTLQQEAAKQEALRQKAASLTEEITKLQRDLVNAAKNTQDQEEALSALEGSLQDLGQREDKAAKTLLKNHDALSHILAAMLRLKREKPQALLIVPETPLETAHTIVLLKNMIPELNRRSEKLREELQAITDLQTTIANKKEEAEGRAKRLTQERAKLETLVTRRQAAHSANQQEQAKLEARRAQLAAEAADLRDLMEKLKAESKAKKAAKAKTKAPPKETASLSGLTLPAKGKILVGYGEKNDLGVTSKGLSIETRPGAQIISPAKGEVVYAGNFRSYGLILIIEYGESYHIMLSNLARIDCAVGQKLVAGEPVGTMAESGSAPRLYVEFRKDGQPVPPQDWAVPKS